MSVSDSDNDETPKTGAKLQNKVMRNDRETNTVYMSDLLPRRHPVLATTLERIFAEEQVRYGYLKGTKDIWCRDYMPIQVGVRKYVRFQYRPDYLTGKYEHLITDVGTVQGLPFEPNKMTTTDLVVDGGNVVRSTRHACMTDKIYRENPAFDREALRGDLETLLGVEVIVVPKEPFDDIGHTDGMLRFVDEATVIVNDYRDISLSYHVRLIEKLNGYGLQTILMPYKPSRDKADLESAWGNYVNFLQVGELILFPTYELAADNDAVEVLQKAFPETKLIGVDCRELSQEGGVLNCVTWNIQE